LGFGEEKEVEEWATVDSEIRRIRSSERLLQLKEEVEEAMRKKATRTQQQQQQFNGKDEEKEEKEEEKEEEKKKEEKEEQQQELELEVEEEKELEALEQSKCSRLSVAVLSSEEQNDYSTSCCSPSPKSSSIGSSSLSFKHASVVAASRDGISPTAQQLDMMVGGFGMATRSVAGSTQTCRRSSFFFEQPQSQSFNLKHQHQHQHKHQHQHQQGKEQTSMYRMLLPIL
jgi:actin-related protein